MKFTLIFITTLGVLAIHINQAYARARARCRSGPGKIYIVREDTIQETPGTYYKVEGTTGTQATRTNNDRLHQRGNPRHLELMDEIDVKNCNEAENSVHRMVKDKLIDSNGGDKWYQVQPDEYDDFKNTIKKAAKVSNGKGSRSAKIKELIESLLA